MKKLQQFHILKFSSDRLRDVNNKVDISLREAYNNGEIISLAESELIRIINRLKGVDVDYQLLNNLLKEKRQIKKLPPSKENRKLIIDINKQIDSVLYIEEIIDVEFTDPRHYNKIIESGLWVNGKKYERLLAGAGMSRRSTVQFVEAEFGRELRRTINNDRNESVPLVDSKFNAYYALVASSGYSISNPKFCVVPDYEFTRNRLVDFVVEPENGGEDYVEERFMPITTNAFDGQGLVSIGMAEKWSHDLGLNYVPNSFCIRGSYLKGQCVAFDFKKFADDISKKYIIKDIWGDEVDIRDMDCILTASQLKLYSSYDNCQEYVESCDRNGINWSVSRFSPKKEKDYFYSSYQLLQVLDLSKDQIENLCKPTVDWLTGVSVGNVDYSLLYSLGGASERETIDQNWFEEIEYWNLKALLLNHDLFGDSYFRKNIYQMLNKKIKESRMGKLLFPGNWQVAISDPYAFCEYLFGMEVNGILNEGEHFCQYWNKKNLDIVACGRSPLTWKSEMNTLHLKNSELLQKWFGHIDSGIILNIHGDDTMRFADSDFDFDILFSTSQKEFIDGASGGKPVTYARSSAPKNIIDESKLHIADINTMGSKIGWITNLGTALYSLVPLFDKDSREYKEIISRLIIIRKLQGCEIDKAKTGYAKEVPKWDKWIRITDKMSDEEKRETEFRNRLVINRRPKFMIYLYPDYMQKYKNHRDIYENYCESIYGYGLDILIDRVDKNNFEKELYRKYQEFNPFIDSDSVMGFICRYMEKSIAEIKLNLKDDEAFDPNVFIAQPFDMDEYKLKLMQEAYKKYRSIKRGIFDFDDSNESVGNKIHELNRWCYERISQNSSELANLAVHLSYFKYKGVANRDFCWKVFGEEIVGNLMKNGYDRAIVPLIDEQGDIQYLGKRFSYLGIKIEERN